MRRLAEPGMVTRTLVYLLCFALACLAAVGASRLLVPLLTARGASIDLASVVSLGLAVALGMIGGHVTTLWVWSRSLR